MEDDTRYVGLERLSSDGHFAGRFGRLFSYSVNHLEAKLLLPGRRLRGSGVGADNGESGD